MKEPRTKQQYLEQLRSALKARDLKDVNEIIEDYEDYFIQSTAKGYSASESIHRLPSVKALAESYENSTGKQEPTSVKGFAQPTRAGRWSLFAATTLSELVMLPFTVVAGLFLACISITGILVFVAGVLMVLPDSLPGSITVPHPPMAQLLPAMALFLASGTAIFGTTLVIAERGYSALRTSIVLKRWMITGIHNDHLKLIPSVSKHTRHSLYKTVLIALLTAIASAILLAIIAAITTDSPSFIRSWNI